MLSSNSNMDAGTHTAGAKINVILKQGLSDQKAWSFDQKFSIGRDSSADIYIKDTTVSRFHAFAHVIGGKWWIRDMNSSNGTFINGRKIVKSRVDHRSELQLGLKGPMLLLCLDQPDLSDSETIVVDLRDLEKYNNQYLPMGNEKETDDVLPAGRNYYAAAKTVLRKLQNRSKKWGKYKPLAACILLGVAILAGYRVLHKPDRTAEDQKKIKVVHSQANSIDAHRPADKPGAADKQSEGIPAGGQNALNYPRVQKNEQPDGLEQEMLQNYTADIYLSAAEKFSDHHRWRPALSYYQKVAEIDPDHRQLDAKIAKMKFEVVNQETLEHGMSLIHEKRYAQGIVKLRRIDENSAYFQQAEQLIIDAEKMKARAAEEQKQKEAEMLKAAKEQETMDAINGALRYYADGDIKSSLDTLNQILSSTDTIKEDLKKRAGTLKEEIVHAKSMFEKGNQAYKSGKINTALSTWKKLIQADQELLGTREGFFAKSIRQKMADEYSAKARKAFSKSDFPAAYQYCQMALKQNGSHPMALEVKKMLNAKSKHLYQAGYVIEAYNPEKAQGRWKQILKICDSDSEYYKKALMKVSAK